MKENNPTSFDMLIAKVLAGEASAVEMSQLAKLRKENFELEEQYIAFEKIWNAKEPITAYDSTAAWENVSKRISSNKKGRVFWLKPLSIAASLILVITLGAVIWNFSGNAIKSTTYTAENTDTLQLPDGTSVVLLANSSITFPEKFEGTERNVSLTGTAFFDVAKNKEKSFIIETEIGFVQVLGTRFFVAANKASIENKVEVSEGKVAVWVKRNVEKREVLFAGDAAILNTTIVKSVADTVAMKFEFTQQLSFENETLANVMETLEKLTNKKIMFESPTAAQCRYTGSFEKQKVSEILKVIASTFLFEVIEQDSIIILKGNGC
jgi:ferric-dicitrate binding protein FerR (iron transport regulator)